MTTNSTPDVKGAPGHAVDQAVEMMGASALVVFVEAGASLDPRLNRAAECGRGLA
jgi:hypothetical protein